MNKLTAEGRNSTQTRIAQHETFLFQMASCFSRVGIAGAHLLVFDPRAHWWQTQLEWKIGYPLERVIRVIWPASIWLMATEGIERIPTAYLFIFMSVAANVILYAVVGSAVWWLKHLLARDNS